MKKLLFILLPAMLLTIQSFAQKQEGREDFEKFKSMKISFLTEKLNLTPKEAESFWPEYNQFEKERMEVQHRRRELEHKTRDENLKLSDQEIIKTTREIATTFRKEAELAEMYNEKFLKILPPQKVLALYRAENQFRAYMFEQYRMKKRENSDK